MNNPQKFFSKYRNIILYAVIGVFSASIDFAVYTVLISITDIAYWIANVLGVSCGMTTSFLLNRRYNFQVMSRPMLRFLLFVAVGLSGMGLSSLIILGFVKYDIFNPIVSKLLSVVVVSLYQYLLNKYLTFKLYKHHG